MSIKLARREFDEIKKEQGGEQASLWVQDRGKVFEVDKFRQSTQQTD